MRDIEQPLRCPACGSDLIVGSHGHNIYICKNNNCGWIGNMVATEQSKPRRRLYKGVRTNGSVVVTVNGDPLKHIVYHSPSGFEWGYAGSGPADLALSILADYFNEARLDWDGRAWQLHQDFKDDFIATIEDDQFLIDTYQIDNWIYLANQSGK